MRRYVVTLEAAPDGDGPPAARRVAGLLKLALRRFGLVAVDVRPADGLDIPSEPSSGNGLRGRASAGARAADSGGD